MVSIEEMIMLSKRIQDISNIENHLTRLLSETIEEESELDRALLSRNYMIHWIILEKNDENKLKMTEQKYSTVKIKENANSNVQYV